MAFLGENIRKARVRLGLSQKELAERSGVSPGAIGDLESGRQQKSTKIHRIAQVLGTTAHDLERGTVPENADGSMAVVSLSEREEELLRLFRAASPAVKRAIEGAAGREPEAPAGEPSRRPSKHRP